MKKTVSALVCLALLLLLVACQEPTAESAPPTSPQPSASQQTTPEPSQEDYIPCAGGYARAEFVPMEDGTEICCLVVTPEKEGQFPTVITQNCYQAATDEFTAEYFESCVADSSAFVEAGYAFVMIQTRGTANSQYESFLAYIHDTDDELQVMDWIRQQDFYNGELFCNGMSYMGFTSMSHLYAPHEDIKAISMQCPVSTRYDAWYQNGFIKIGLMGYWQAMMHRPAGFDGTALGNTMDMTLFNTFPYINWPVEMYGEQDEYWTGILTHPEDGEWWRTEAAGSYIYDAIAAFCEIEQATVGSILLRMERDGLVRRTQRDGNRRSLYVSLTPEGRRMGERMAEIFRRADAQAAAGLTPEEQDQLRVLLEKVYGSVSPERRRNG